MAKKRKTHSLEIDELSSILIPDDSELGPKAAQDAALFCFYMVIFYTDNLQLLLYMHFTFMKKRFFFAVIISSFLHIISGKKVAKSG